MSKKVQIRCHRVKSRDPKHPDFARVCGHILFEFDKKGRLVITCPECGRPTVISFKGSEDLQDQHDSPPGDSLSGHGRLALACGPVEGTHKNTDGGRES